MSEFLTRLEELDKAATSAPWMQQQVDNGNDGDEGSPAIYGPDMVIYDEGGHTAEDAALIVHLRNHTDEIIALVKAARKWIDAYSAVKYTDEEDDAFQATRAALEALDK